MTHALTLGVYAMAGLRVLVLVLMWVPAQLQAHWLRLPPPESRVSFSVLILVELIVFAALLWWSRTGSPWAVAGLGVLAAIAIYQAIITGTKDGVGLLQLDLLFALIVAGAAAILLIRGLAA